MKRRLLIEGMMCGHCTSRVEKALNALPGVTAKVDLKGADVTGEAPEALLRETIEKAGYRLTAIQ